MATSARWRTPLLFFIYSAIIIAFIRLVWYASSNLGGSIPEETFRPLEYALFAGILLGVLPMFQSWVFGSLRSGFYVLLASKLLYVLWSHGQPKGENVSEFTSVAAAELGGTGPY